MTLASAALARAATILDPGFRALAIYDALDQASGEEKKQLTPIALAQLEEIREEVRAAILKAEGFLWTM